MKFCFLPFLCFLVSILAGLQFAHAQGVSGQITDVNGVPISYANIFIEELGSGTASDEQGNFFLTLPNRGDYRLICSAIGFQTLVDTIIVEEEFYVKNIRLKASTEELNEIVVSASKKDPAYAIMRKVIDRKKEYQKSIGSYRAQVYIKAREDIETLEKGKKKKKKLFEVEEEGIDAAGNIDDELNKNPFDEAEAEKEKLLSGLNMLEIQLQLNYQYPRKYKEERLAYKLYGKKEGLFIPRFGESDFNFYRNQVDFADMTEVNITSPLSTTAILSYKYKLEETFIEGSQTVYKIKVIPRKSGNATVKGDLYINADLWNINRLDLKIAKGNLRFFDQLSIEQTYQAINDTLWLPVRQAFVYQTKEGKRKKFDGQTTIRYADIEVDYPFPPKFFGNEISITKAEAYKRDSIYWNSTRIEPLTNKEKEVVYLRDSIEAVINSKDYKDSIQNAYNKITFQDIIWDGVGFRNHEKQRQIYIGALPNLIDFEVIGGFRLGPYINFFKRWKNGVIFSGFGNVDIGLKRWDVQGVGYLRLRYAPLKQADLWINGGRTFNSINNFDAYLNQLRRNNYILTDVLNLGHRIEIVNGLYLESIFGFADRNPAPTEGTETFLEEFLTDVPPIEFIPYQTFFTELSLSYTPRQKYLSEPIRKVILGSKWPTFSINYKKGWKDLFASDVDYDYLDFQIRQDIEFGALGNSKYLFQIGKFTNTRNLRFVDLKRFRESDPILYSNALRTFQALDTSLTTTNLFIEFHHIHHFNGALINNIPLVKKTNVRVVAGGGALWVKDNNYRHEEVFAGLERVFKLGARRRLRLGVYGVLANSNVAKGDATFKISIDIIDTWKKEWSF